jgi:hypothetical protein
MVAVEAAGRYLLFRGVLMQFTTATKLPQPDLVPCMFASNQDLRSRDRPRKKNFNPYVLNSLRTRMGKIMVTLSDELENREHLRKQGDLPRIITEALTDYLDGIEKRSRK